VDIEEAKFQATKRKEAIERAKTLLYYQTDRVKKFHVRTYNELFHALLNSLEGSIKALRSDS